MVKCFNLMGIARAATLTTGLIFGLAACSSLDQIASPDKTDAPAAGFEKLTSGSEEDFMLNVGRRTYFAESSAVLDDTAKVTLDKQAAWLAKHTGWKVKVQGFADDPGSADKQVDISKKRAQAVYDYLVSKGRVITNLREEFDT
jgi:peptidoglycan-associated lipoprotein